MNYAISVKNLTKMYGKSLGIHNLTLSVPKGQIFGFIGPNGAGKTTTISMLVGLTHPSSGSIKILDQDITKKPTKALASIGFLSSDMALDGKLTGWQQLEYYSHIRGDFDKKYITKLAKRLNCNLNKKIKTLSRGNRQKVGLISALMHKPRLLILDEPTSGLDPLIQAEFNKIIQEHKATGGTTFISSHVLSEIQELCDHIAFIKDGRLISNTSIQELTKASPKIVRLESVDTAKIAQQLQKTNPTDNIHTTGQELSFNYRGDVNKLLQILSKHHITSLSIENAELDTIFMNLYRSGDNKNAQ